jgi:hypothetical protein
MNTGLFGATAHMSDPTMNKAMIEIKTSFKLKITYNLPHVG